MAAGKVITGFSNPYVAWMQDGENAWSLSGGRKLARGVSVSVDIDSPGDDNFSADNAYAEHSKNTFSSGTLTLVVDGMLELTERFLIGQAKKDDGWVCYDDRQKSDYFIAVGFIVRYKSDGVDTFVPMVFPKCKFNPIPTSAATQEENIEFQTQELTAKIYRIKGSPKHPWKYVGDEETTEAEAEAALKTKLGIT